MIRELADWRDKWVYHELRTELVRDLAVSDSLNAQSLARLRRTIDSLKTIYPVRINDAVLDTLKMIDFKKSRWASMQVYKRSSGRMAVPVVDPDWGF